MCFFLEPLKKRLEAPCICGLGAPSAILKASSEGSSPSADHPPIDASPSLPPLALGLGDDTGLGWIIQEISPSRGSPSATNSICNLNPPWPRSLTYCRFLGSKDTGLFGVGGELFCPNMPIKHQHPVDLFLNSWVLHWSLLNSPFHFPPSQH